MVGGIDFLGQIFHVFRFHFSQFCFCFPCRQFHLQGRHTKTCARGSSFLLTGTGDFTGMGRGHRRRTGFFVQITRDAMAHFGHIKRFVDQSNVGGDIQSGMGGHRVGGRTVQGFQQPCFGHFRHLFFVHHRGFHIGF